MNISQKAEFMVEVTSLNTLLSFKIQYCELLKSSNNFSSYTDLNLLNEVYNYYDYIIITFNFMATHLRKGCRNKLFLSCRKTLGMQPSRYLQYLIFKRATFNWNTVFLMTSDFLMALWHNRVSTGCTCQNLSRCNISYRYCLPTLSWLFFSK